MLHGRDESAVLIVKHNVKASAAACFFHMDEHTENNCKDFI